MSGPLAGIRVIDITSAVLGPVATQHLGDLGADVIKIEPPGGDFMRQLGPARHPGMSAYFLNINRNKRSLVLDLKRPAHHAVLMELIDGADVVVHNMRLPAALRLGLDYDALAARNPRLVLAFATGFNLEGSQRDRPAFDDIIQGESGFAAVNAAGGEPRFVPMALCDKMCGQQLASAIGMALFARERTGKGQLVHVPMLETMLAFNLMEHLWYGTFGEPEKGIGYPRMFTPHRRPCATRDGYICLMATTDDQWRRLFAAIGRPELADDPRYATLAARTVHVDESYGIVTAAMRERTTAEWRAILDAADVPNGEMRTLESIYENQYLWDTGFFQRVEHPSEGPTVALAPTTRFAGTPAELRLPAPTVGQHSRDVLRELGKTDSEIAALGV